MGKIIHPSEKEKLSSLKLPGQTLVLVGGCFDILHAGHIEYLKKAKGLGNSLIVLLESDEKIKKLKGENRPANNQTYRSSVLSNLPMVSYVYLLPELKSDSDYEILVKTIQPDIIALTAQDRVYGWEKTLENQGFLKIVRVMDKKENYSTTKLIKNLKK